MGEGTGCVRRYQFKLYRFRVGERVRLLRANGILQAGTELEVIGERTKKGYQAAVRLATNNVGVGTIWWTRLMQIESAFECVGDASE